MLPFRRRRRCRAAARAHPRQRLRHRHFGRHDVAHDDRAVAHVDEGVDHPRIGGGHENEQSAHLAEAGDEPAPPVVGEQLLVVHRPDAGRHDEQLARVGHAVRDLRERDAVQEAVDDTVRVVVLDERLDRRRFAEQVADRDAAMHGLHARDAQRGLGGGHRVRADDDDRVEGVERGADAPSLFAPIHRARRAHGPPS